MEIDESDIRRSPQFGDDMFALISRRARKPCLVEHVERAFDLRGFYEKVDVGKYPVEFQAAP